MDFRLFGKMKHLEKRLDLLETRLTDLQKNIAYQVLPGEEKTGNEWKEVVDEWLNGKEMEN